MKLLIVSGGYLPAQNYGGPVVSLMNFTEHLGDDYIIDILCRNHDLHSQTPFEGIREGFQPVGKAQVCYLPDSEMKYSTFRKILEERQPDCLYLSSIFDAGLNVPLLRLARKQRIPVVYAPRGELNPAVLAMKGLKKKLFLTVMRLSGLYKKVYFQASSPEERSMTIRALRVQEDHVIVAPNLPSAPFCGVHRQKQAGTLRVIFLARIHRSKNLAYAIDRLCSLHGNVSLDIYGPIEHPDYWQECLDKIREAPQNVQIRYCGTVPVGQAGEVMGQYDCFLFPTLSENYGQVIAEAVQAGTLPVISLGTTPWDDIEGGIAVPLNRPEDFTHHLQALLEMEEERFSCRRAALLRYGAHKLHTKTLVEQTKNLFAAATGG